MNMFSNLTVLSAPTTENKDWSFILGDLQFEVHESMVELKSSLDSFDKFARSVDALDMLLEYIDEHNGKLDKHVFDFVNQNNELASALGIVMPYSFATEEEQAQAGNDVKEAANGKEDDDDNNTGFFAKAWDTIKKFFKAIKDALVKAWGAITGKEKAEDQQNQAANKALESMHPKEVQAAMAAAYEGAGKVFITLKDAQDMAADIEKIAQHCTSIGNSFGTPVEFFKFIDKFDGSFAASFEPVRDVLKNLGITLIDGNVNGVKVTKAEKSGKTIYDITPEKMKTARDAFIGDNGDRAISNAKAFIGPDSSVRQITKNAIKSLDALIKNINSLLDGMEKPEAVAEITKIIEGGSFKQWLRKMANMPEAQKRINIAKEVGRNISGALSIILEVVKLADSKIMGTCKAIDKQILLRNQRADNKDVKDLNARRQKDANIEAQHKANASADENAAQRGEDPYGDSIG